MGKPCTEIYCSGFNIEKPIQFSDIGLFSKCDLSADELRSYALECADALTLGHFIAYSDAVSVKLTVDGDEQEALARIVWNCQWYLMLISLLVDEPVLPLFIRHVTADKSEVYLQNRHFFSVTTPNYPTFDISEYELANHLDMFGQLMGDRRFQSAVSSLYLNGRSPNPFVNVALVWSAIEGLFDFSSELRYRISLQVSALLADSPRDRKQLFKKLQRLYDGRSKCVHGSAKVELAKSVDAESKLVLRQLLLKVLDRGAVWSKAEAEQAVFGKD